MILSKRSERSLLTIRWLSAAEIHPDASVAAPEMRYTTIMRKSIRGRPL